MNRRDFIGGIGGLVAVSALPAVGATKRATAMSVNYISLPVGAERPFTVFHISDTHLKGLAPTDTEAVRKHLAPRFAGYDPEEALADSINWAQRHRCDYLLHTGDLIDCATDGNVALLKRFFGCADNILYAPGNHEYATDYAAPRPPQTEAEFRAINTAKVQAVVPVDMQFHSMVLHGVNFVMMDDVYGTVSPIAVERFHAEARKGLPIVLCQHVPFFSPGIALAHARSHMSDRALDELIVPIESRDFKRQAEDKVTADFIRYLKSEPLLRAILAGHYHCEMSDRFSPTAMQYVAGANFRHVGQETMIY